MIPVIVVGDRDGSFYRRHREATDDQLFADVEGDRIVFLNRLHSDGNVPSANNWPSRLVIYKTLNPDQMPELWAKYCALRLTQ